jgi:hypothetical protein
LLELQRVAAHLRQVPGDLDIHHDAVLFELCSDQRTCLQNRVLN